MLKILEAGEYGSPVLFNWRLIDECQFKCSYCYATDFNKEHNFKKGLYKQSHSLVINKLKRLDFEWVIDLQGGEPTLHPNLKEIISSLESMDNCKRIVLATNLSQGKTFYQQFDNLGSKLAIHASYHPQYHKKIFNRLFELYKTLIHTKLFVEVILYPKKEYFDQLLNLLIKLKDNNIPFGTNLVHSNQYWDGVVDDGFYELFEPWLKEGGSNVKNIKHLTPDGIVYYSDSDIIKNKISYKGFTCEALAYTIDINGDILNTCTGRKVPFLPKKSDIKQLTICPNASSCSCGDMFFYKKVSNDYNA